VGGDGQPLIVHEDLVSPLLSAVGAVRQDQLEPVGGEHAGGVAAGGVAHDDPPDARAEQRVHHASRRESGIQEGVRRATVDDARLIRAAAGQRGLIGHEGLPGGRAVVAEALLAIGCHLLPIEGIQRGDPLVRLRQSATLARDAAEALLGDRAVYEESPPVAVSELTEVEVGGELPLRREVAQEGRGDVVVARRSAPGGELASPHFEGSSRAHRVVHDPAQQGRGARKGDVARRSGGWKSAQLAAQAQLVEVAIPGQQHHAFAVAPLRLEQRGHDAARPGPPVDGVSAEHEGRPRRQQEPIARQGHERVVLREVGELVPVSLDVGEVRDRRDGAQRTQPLLTTRAASPRVDSLRAPRPCRPSLAARWRPCRWP
jgi:hypothetical protein